MRRRQIGVSVSVGVLVGLALWIMGTQLSQAQAPDLPPTQLTSGVHAQPTNTPPTQLTGEALADALGLELQPSMPSGCRAYVVVRSPDVGYCLEGYVELGLETWEVGRRLAGIVPTDLERQIFLLGEELSRLSPPEDSDKIEELGQKLQILLDQLPG